MPSHGQVFNEELIINEIADTKIEHIGIRGGNEYDIVLPEMHVTMLLFLKGEATLTADSITQTVTPESITIPMNGINSLQIKVPKSGELHFLKFTKKLSLQDVEDIKAFPEKNKYKLYFKRFVDCQPYTEKIKSPNTTSRTVLPADIVPRVSLGTVEAMGPDKVGAHKHPMLDQLFLGLSDNDIVVHADNTSVKLNQYELLHIPIGSSHGVRVDQGKKMNYMWMDFFLTKEGQQWLKTHKPASSDNDE
ncbi:hypothetical protein GCM10011368_31870 [Hyunsoonleella pacifica]|nr:hypothetical protein GCM10011368_31870 [Hyunsoonleella pacifica]